MILDEPQTLSNVVHDSQYAEMTPEDRSQLEKEQSSVKKLWEEYKQSRDFDADARSQYAVDRRYAAGTADPTWAVNTNLIGSFIDVLVSFLYARDPDVSVKKAPQVDNRGSKERDAFAKTMELVISSLWKKGRLKPQARKVVRSTLSVGVGWLKAVLFCDKPENPTMAGEMNDLRDNLAALADVQRQLSEIQGADTSAIDAQVAKQEELMHSLEDKVEATIRKYLAVDFVPAQDMATSLDVATTEDYLDADWNANAVYKLKDQAQQLFPRLTKADIDSATVYYQRQNRDTTALTDRVRMPGMGESGVDSKEAEYYTTNGAPNGMSTSATTSGPAFIKVVELWDKRTNHIKTMVEGVNRWAKEPFEPAYASTRFYPYFRLSFYEVDGSRHAQSLSWRLAKLQDEYARSRSNFRITRERSIPGTVFNKAGMTPEDAAAITKSVHQEMVGITPVNPETPIQNLIAQKPVPAIDGRLFDNTPILGDMEKISGVQEALQSSTTSPKTATEASIQQSGFASRTTSDRDTLEDMLTDLANYTAEVALGGLTVKDAQRIGGPAAFWPAGMAVDDLVTMVELSIKAGSTGKPGVDNSQQAWGVILPVLKEAITEIYAALGTGNVPLARAISELVRKTMSIMGDDTDPELFIPEIPEEMLDNPSMVGGAPIGTDPSLPPTVGGMGGLPLPQQSQDGLTNPQLSNPELENPPL